MLQGRRDAETVAATGAVTLIEIFDGDSTRENETRPFGNGENHK